MKLNTALATIATPETGLTHLHQLVEQDLVAVNHMILEMAGSRASLIPAIAGHIAQSGGKRLRPMLTLAAARLCGYGGADHVKLASAVEYIHTATLLHDDVVDESKLRRGRDTANALWGNQAPILVGDYVYAQAFILMVQVGQLDVFRIFSESVAQIAEGEVLQLEKSQSLAATQDDYMAIITAKTAALFAAACEVGAVIAGRPEFQEPLRQYGNAMGLAFQIIDDVLDYTGEKASLGKTVGDDFREGKVTLPVMLAYQQADASDRARMEGWFASPDARDAQALAAMTALMQRLGTLTQANAMAEAFVEQALQALSALPAHPLRDALEATVRFSISRHS